MVYLFLCKEENTGVNNYAEVTTPRVNTTKRHKHSNVYHVITTKNGIPCFPTQKAVRPAQGGKNENTHTCKIKQRNKNKQENKKLTYQLE